MKTLTREEITAIRFRIKFDDVDLCVIDAPDLDKLLTLAESLISKPADNSKPDDEKPWEVDHEETESGSGKFHYYFIANERGKVVCDTLNSDVITIETDYDFGHAYSWDEQGKKDLTRLVECRNALANVPDPAKLIEAVHVLLEEQSAMVKYCGPHDNELGRLFDALRAALGPKGVGK